MKKKIKVNRKFKTNQPLKKCLCAKLSARAQVSSCKSDLLFKCIFVQLSPLVQFSPLVEI